MKKTILSTMICASIFSTTAMAQEYTVTGNSLISDNEVQNIIEQFGDQGINAVAVGIYNKYKANGIINLKINGDKATNTIEIKEIKTDIVDSEYSDYFDKTTDLNKSDVNLASRRLIDLFENNQVKPTFKIANYEEDGQLKSKMTIETIEEKDKKFASGYGSISNSGSKYTSSYIVSGNVKKKLGNGYAVSVFGSKGLSELGEASGGDIQSLGVATEKASSLGTFKLSYAVNDYTVGKEYEDFGLKGNSKDLTLSNSYFLTNDYILKTSLVHSQNYEEISAFDVNSSYDYNAITADLIYSNPEHGKAIFSIKKGFLGSEYFNYQSLHGDFNDTFQVASLDYENTLPIGQSGFYSTVLVGGQVSSDGTPDNQQFSIGGFKSVNSGLYSSVKIGKTINGYKLFGGVDGSKGQAIVGDDIDVRSAFVGVNKYFDSASVYLDARYAQNIGDTVNNISNNDLTINLTKLF